MNSLVTKVMVDLFVKPRYWHSKVQLYVWQQLKRNTLNIIKHYIIKYKLDRNKGRLKN